MPRYEHGNVPISETKGLKSYKRNLGGGKQVKKVKQMHFADSDTFFFVFRFRRLQIPEGCSRLKVAHADTFDLN